MTKMKNEILATLEGDRTTITSALEKADTIYTAVFVIGEEEIKPSVFRVTIKITI